jgi:hypothetical protein
MWIWQVYDLHLPIHGTQMGTAPHDLGASGIHIVCKKNSQ